MQVSDEPAFTRNTNVADKLFVSDHRSAGRAGRSPRVAGAYSGVSAVEDVAKVLDGPSPVEQCRVAGVLGTEVLDQGHIVVEVERPDQGEQAGRLAGDGGDWCDEPVVELYDLVNHR